MTRLAVGAWEWSYPLDWDLSPVTGLAVETAEALEWVILLTGEARRAMGFPWVDLERALRALGSELGQEPERVRLLPAVSDLSSRR